VTVCYVCETELVPDACAPDNPATYQFDNALWIGMFGGYAMFVDNLEAKLPTNTEDRWLRDADGEYLSYTDPVGRVHPVENPTWKAEFRESRILEGADYEAVICHECAHALCATVPWIEKLINPHGSHAHRTDYHDAHPDHYGWDYDPR
jgi:hypothetical protein